MATYATETRIKETPIAKFWVASDGALVLFVSKVLSRFIDRDCDRCAGRLFYQHLWLEKLAYTLVWIFNNPLRNYFAFSLSGLTMARNVARGIVSPVEN